MASPGAIKYDFGVQDNAPYSNITVASYLYFSCPPGLAVKPLTVCIGVRNGNDNYSYTSVRRVRDLVIEDFKGQGLLETPEAYAELIAQLVSRTKGVNDRHGPVPNPTGPTTLPIPERTELTEFGKLRVAELARDMFVRMTDISDQESSWAVSGVSFGPGARLRSLVSDPLFIGS